MKTIQKPHNKLTPAQAERLAMLAEEAGEIVRAVGKILRHGYESYHPDDPAKLPNRLHLLMELRDLDAVQEGMEMAGDIPADATAILRLSLQDRWTRKMRYTHHQ